MCWGMIGWNYKGPFHIWEKETKEEKEDAQKQIKALNAGWIVEQKRLNDEWKTTEEWRQLKERELKMAREAKAAAKLEGEKCAKTKQSWRGNKYQREFKLQRGDVKGIDSWRYVTVLGRPILYPECKRRMGLNRNFILMEDNAAAHNSEWTNMQRRIEGIPKADWPPNSPDFNPIERIWALMKRRIQRRRGSERVTTRAAMAAALREEWDRITLEDINNEIQKLPTIMKRCLHVNGGNKFHA
jgi:transposase